jgi:hypothetical protein
VPAVIPPSRDHTALVDGHPKSVERSPAAVCLGLRSRIETPPTVAVDSKKEESIAGAKNLNKHKPYDSVSHQVVL